jgi:hypothetical protein
VDEQADDKPPEGRQDGGGHTTQDAQPLPEEKEGTLGSGEEPPESDSAQSAPQADHDGHPEHHRGV